MGVFQSDRDSETVRRAQAAYIEALLADLLPAMRLAAKGCGYALTIHGSEARDIDLVAIPWVEGAGTAELLVNRLCGVIAGATGRACPNAEWSDKPHGRRAVLIMHAGHTAEFDLSIMPRVEKPQT